MSRDKRGERHTYGRLNYEGYSTGFVAPNLKPVHRVRVNLKRVPCMECKAEIDQPCISLITGGIKHNVHASRKRIAIRRYNEERGL